MREVRTKTPYPRPADHYDHAAAGMLATLTQDALSELLRQYDEEHKRSTRIISALLELLGGQTYLPRHVMDNTPGYEALPGQHSGDLVLRSFSDGSTEH